MIYINTHDELLRIIEILDADTYQYIIDNPDGLDFSKKATGVTSLVLWTSTKQGSAYWMALSRRVGKFKRNHQEITPRAVLPDELFNM